MIIVKADSSAALNVWQTHGSIICAVLVDKQRAASLVVVGSGVVIHGRFVGSETATEQLLK